MNKIIAIISFCISVGVTMSAKAEIDIKPDDYKILETKANEDSKKNACRLIAKGVNISNASTKYSDVLIAVDLSDDISDF